MNSIELLLSRKSHNKLIAPAPTKEQLETLFKAALRAPDHALLRPWRYRVYESDGLDRLGEAFVQASRQSDPELSAEKLEKIRTKPKRAPMVIVASVKITEHPKVPPIEQILSGGASVQNLLMAAHFQSIGAMWRTGALAFDENLKSLLGCDANESIIGFIYLGSEEGQKRLPKAVELTDHVSME